MRLNNLHEPPCPRIRLQFAFEVEATSSRAYSVLARAGWYLKVDMTGVHRANTSIS